MSNDETQATSGTSTGKGRPTPSRKEAQAARQAQLKVDVDSKAGRKAARERDRLKRVEVREQMLAGNPKYLPARDSGPARAMTRDFVDARLSMGEFFVPVAFVVIVLDVMPAQQFKAVGLMLLVSMWVIILIDTIYLGFSLKKTLRRDLPADTNLRGCTTYGVMRALQMRRFRMPKPQVTRGRKK